MRQSQHWTPYPWEPVHHPGVDFRVTYAYSGEIEAMVALIGGRKFEFTVGEDSAEVIIPDVEMDSIPDRARAEVRVLTGGAWNVLCEGHLTRRLS